MPYGRLFRGTSYIWSPKRAVFYILSCTSIKDVQMAIPKSDQCTVSVIYWERNPLTHWSECGFMYKILNFIYAQNAGMSLFMCISGFPLPHYIFRSDRRMWHSWWSEWTKQRRIYKEIIGINYKLDWCRLKNYYEFDFCIHDKWRTTPNDLLAYISNGSTLV